jgi:hypothetical protein
MRSNAGFTCTIEYCWLDRALVEPQLLLRADAFGDVLEIDREPVRRRVRSDFVPDPVAQRIFEIVHRLVLGHRFVQLAIALGARTFGEELPAHASDQTARAHAEDLLGLFVEVREAPFAVHRHECVADAFEDLAGIERRCDRLFGLQITLQNPALAGFT